MLRENIIEDLGTNGRIIIKFTLKVRVEISD